MRRPLSILSFSKVNELFKPNKTFYWTMFWLACLMLIGQIVLKTSMNISTSRIGKVIKCLNSNLNEKNNRDDFVLFMGSSRFESAININTLKEMSHLKNITFLNLSRPSMGPWHYSVVLRNIETPVLRVKLVALEISPWMFNANALHPTTKLMLLHRDELLKWGTIRERLEIKETGQRIRAVTIGMIPRNSLSDYILAIQKSGPIFELPIPVYHLNQINLNVLSADPNFKAENIAISHLHKFKFLQSEADKLRELISELNKSGIAVSLIHPPVRSEYYNYLDTDYRYRLEFEKYKSFIKSFSVDHQVVYWEKPSDCGLDDSIFVDYGHLSREGSILFTKRLGAEIATVIE